ncbi:MAG: glycosyltransferase [Candidatus Scatovivens sp.]
MKILIVIDQYDGANNGTTISARRFVENLRKRGHEVKIITTGEENEDKFIVNKVRLLPIVNWIITSQGMTFAKADEEKLKEAINWAEVVHFYMPFWLSMKGMKYAKSINKPMTAAFHVQPENITYTIGLGKNNFVNDKIYSFFREYFYDEFNHIHCPSLFIANELKEHNYKAKLHVISNGIEEDFVYAKKKKPDNLKDKIILTMVGRLSGEKRQDILIEAVKKSKYKDKIQIILAGNGPKKRKYYKISEDLNNKLIIDFFEKEKLKDLLTYSDLYIHTSDAEIEAISCIEAFASGLVPIIAESNKSATSQFALDNRSLFKAGDSNDLAKKIDYWLDNNEERKNMEKEYAKYANNYRIEKSMEKIEEMFKEEINERRNLL